MVKSLLAFAAILAYVYGVGSDPVTCHVSDDCAPGSCCRDVTGTVLSRQDGRFFFNFIHLDGNGTCIIGRAKKYELCDATCNCDTGLECYRPMTGVCCPPMRCDAGLRTETERDLERLLSQLHHSAIT